MTRSDHYVRLTQILRAVFDDDALVAKRELNASDVDSWDSLGRVLNFVFEAA